jgi:hypothetical protein
VIHYMASQLERCSTKDQASGRRQRWPRPRCLLGSSVSDRLRLRRPAGWCGRCVGPTAPGSTESTVVQRPSLHHSAPPPHWTESVHRFRLVAPLSSSVRVSITSWLSRSIRLRVPAGWCGRCVGPTARGSTVVLCPSLRSPSLQCLSITKITSWISRSMADHWRWLHDVHVPSR